MNTGVVRYCTCGCLTGDGQGDVLADDSDLSLSSGSSTELIRMFRAVSRRRLCTGLDGAKIAGQKKKKKHRHQIGEHNTCICMYTTVKYVYDSL